jgi:hypothetical protein
VGQQDQQNHQSGSPIKLDIQKDIAWLRQSQPLMCDTQEVTLLNPSDLESAVNQQPSMVTYPAQPAYRLGKHFEDCVQGLFESSKANHIVARNIVIQTPERTLGELDLIYKNANQQWVHLELAIKFYLLTKDGSKLSDYIGPAGHDRLDLKWERLRDHQLSLSKKPKVIEFLQQQAIPQPTKRELLLTGMLFYAYENWTSIHLEGLGINPQHQRGFWLEHHEISQLQHTHQCEQGYIVLPKWHWIGGPNHYETPTPVDYTTMVELTTADPWPNMILVYEKTQTGWVFKVRGLILATKKPPLVT